MISNPNLTLSQTLMLGTILALSAYLGLRRGVNRELVSTIGIVVGTLFSSRLADMFTPSVNRFYRLGRFALSGGITGDDPAGTWQKMKALPDLVSTPLSQQVLTLCLFFAILLIFYLVGQRSVPAGKTLVLRLLGVFAGAINGFLVAYFLSPYLLNVPKTTIVLPSAELSKILTNRHNVALVLFVFVSIMIAFGLYNAGPARRK